MNRRYLFFFFVAPLLAQLPPARQQEIEKLVAQEMSRQNMPGISIAVAVGGELIWSAGYGFADLENFVPAKPLTMYRLASVSKPITAVSILQLSENGKIDLDQSIRRYVPSFPAKPWTITVRQLLGHLGGIRHYETDEEVNNTRHYPDMLTPLKLFQSDPLVAEPAHALQLLSYGYVLLGAALEAASGQRYMEYPRSRLRASRNGAASSGSCLCPHSESRPRLCPEHERPVAKLLAGRHEQQGSRRWVDRQC
jgi:CubicO group peptidase (beta-lactamase class C family)